MKDGYLNSFKPKTRMEVRNRVDIAKRLSTTYGEKVLTPSKIARMTCSPAIGAYSCTAGKIKQYAVDNGLAIDIAKEGLTHLIGEKTETCYIRKSNLDAIFNGLGAACTLGDLEKVFAI